MVKTTVLVTVGAILLAGCGPLSEAEQEAIGSAQQALTAPDPTPDPTPCTSPGCIEAGPVPYALRLEAGAQHYIGEPFNVTAVLKARTPLAACKDAPDELLDRFQWQFYWKNPWQPFVNKLASEPSFLTPSIVTMETTVSSAQPTKVPLAQFTCEEPGQGMISGCFMVQSSFGSKGSACGWDKTGGNPVLFHWWCNLVRVECVQKPKPLPPQPQPEEDPPAEEEQEPNVKVNGKP